MTLPPGALNQARRLRWNIEKAYDQQEQKHGRGQGLDGQ
jgi:hypothetical protein